VLAPIRQIVEEVLRGSGARGRVSIAEDDFTAYTGARVTAPNFAAAWYVSEDDAIVQRALQALAEAGMAPHLTHYAFCTNGSGTAGLGIPTIGFGPGDAMLAHRADEHIDAGELVAAARGYAALVRRLIGQGDST
jgi:acetylornithine deacetylase/succinyl-diaminopimelate desuccinylase-like protein